MTGHESAARIANDQEIEARRILVAGRVQGVGFRPFVHALAEHHAITGSVRNVSGQVLIHAEGDAAALAAFARALIAQAPGFARPRIASMVTTASEGHRRFVVAPSAAISDAEIHLPPDQFVCGDCLAELCDPSDRRHRYPFITCTQCGPRYTIIARLPYDRANTSMAAFELCDACRRDYEDASDRRFHAEPLGCELCGPSLTFKPSPYRTPDAEQGIVRGNEAALAAALEVLRRGGVVAVKGVGGYHLMCDAARDSAVANLRRRKRRPAKPLAVMFPQRGDDGLASIRECVVLDDAAAQALLDPIRPIVVAVRREGCGLSPQLAPGLGELGVMLPYSPLHALLLGDFGAPLVATSGNVSGEPVITTVADAEARLSDVADAFLHHDRDILRPADDPVVRVVAGVARALRLGRGSAPLEMPLSDTLADPVLATGSQMKNAIGIGIGNRAVLSPHIGEMESPRAVDLFTRLADELPRLHGVTAQRIVGDAHGGYAASQWARRQRLPVMRVLHHVAHASALAGEYPAVARWLVFTWDGVGLGDDGTLWGGEALLGRPGGWQRAASFSAFELPGGDAAARAPWRSAAALMWQADRNYAPVVAGSDCELIRQAWLRRINTNKTSAVGRLFDAAAALILAVAVVSYEGEAPMLLEHLAGTVDDEAAAGLVVPLPLHEDDGGMLRADASVLLDMLCDTTRPPAVRARAFHLSLADTLVAQVRAIAARGAVFDAVGATGGVFQNKLLAELVVERLTQHGIAIHLPVAVPANDGGLAFGQIVEAAARLGTEQGRQRGPA